MRGEDSSFVAGDENGDGRLAYSTDGAPTFALTGAMPDSGNVQSTPDEELALQRLNMLLTTTPYNSSCQQARGHSG